MGHQLTLPHPPQRIISLVPSQTELLFDLGLGERLVGVTKFCLHPKEQVKQKTVIGGTKNFRFDVIAQLQPDLIIGNKEENYKEGIEQLQRHYPVWMSDIYTLDDALQMMQQLGDITATTTQAFHLMQQVRSGFESLKPLAYPVSTAYFIWRGPYMAVGNYNIIDHMLQRCGFRNAFAALARYPVVEPEQLQQANPQLILLSSEPYPFKEKHILEFQQLCPQAFIKVVDGEMFSWYGSRLLNAPAYLQTIIEEVAESLKR
ncbi:helical backbone metal receptor [Pontibacter sp. SGAir0037]|uniref:helical backbone metal receptor n=1 Tax=Pontibacter sp. SGAir0037 TaxID=2571030 RepID=UPI0010CCB2E1|nr:helical backbone metal receptor [Pontibacter sp. SGAir0037]QCR25211.1 cobalamin-binding protein [Pontibacter sp. SGAir0037]